MKYDDYLATKPKPFSSPLENCIIDQTLLSYVYPARSPYVQDHLLVIPKREVIFHYELSSEERHDLWELADKWLRIMHQHISNVTVLLRDSFADDSGKSIAHLHIHLIPSFDVHPPGGVD